MTITYANVIAHDTTDDPRYGRNVDGYGRKIATRHRVRLAGDGARWRRVYAVCFSNVASFYVVRNGQDLWLNEWDLQD